MVKEVEVFINDWKAEDGDGMVEITASSRTRSVEVKFLVTPGHDFPREDIHGGKRLVLTLEDRK